MSVITPVLCTFIIEGNSTLAVETPIGPVSSANVCVRFPDLHTANNMLVNFIENLKVLPFDDDIENLPEANATQELIDANNEVGALVTQINERFYALEEGSNAVIINFVFSETLMLTIMVRTTGVMQQSINLNEDQIKWYLTVEAAELGDIFVLPNGDGFIECDKLQMYLGTFDTYRDLVEKLMCEPVRFVAKSKAASVNLANSIQMLKTEMVIEIDNYAKLWETEVISTGFQQPIAVADSLLTLTLSSTGGPEFQDSGLGFMESQLAE